MMKEKIFLSNKDLAKRWVRSPRTIEGWRARKIGRDYLNLNGKIVYDLEDIIKFEKASKVSHQS